MSFASTLSMITIATSLAFSTTASATANLWDSANPWGSATLSEYAEWNSFASTTNNTAPQFGTGASLVGTAGSILFGGDIYTFNSIASFTATLAGSSGIVDVYLRAATQGNLLSASATLNGVAATSILAYGDTASQGLEQEVYWKWSNVTANNLYTFNFSAAAPHVLLDQLSLSTVAAVSAVPEPESYAMLLAGLGLLGLVSRKYGKH